MMIVDEAASDVAASAVPASTARNCSLGAFDSDLGREDAEDLGLFQWNWTAQAARVM